MRERREERLALARKDFRVLGADLWGEKIVV